MASKRKHDEAFTEPADDASAPTRLPRASQEIVTYFEELKTHFDSLVDKEEQSLLVANALEEASGQECAVATDPICSRVLEALLPAAEPPQLAKFFQAVLKGEGLIAIASRCSFPDMSDVAASSKHLSCILACIPACMTCVNCCSPFGSHVIEAVLGQLAVAQQDTSADGVEISEVRPAHYT